MKAKLIGYTQVASGVDAILDTVQDMIAYCAKVSNPKGQQDMDTSDRLLKYLIKHKHWSPFEMVSATVEIETTRDIARQMLRHRSFSFQEFSQRYADPNEMEETFVVREARLQDPENRQNSLYVDNKGLDDWWTSCQLFHIEQTKLLYKAAMEMGIAKEQARCILPEGNTVSKLYVNGTIRSWIHYVELRSGNGTQKEHMELAVQIGKAISEIFPLIGDVK
jgi:thymidylate synthase (FAD)